MNTKNQQISPLRQHLIEDMKLRKLGGKSQSAYIRAVQKLSNFLHHSPDTATAEELRDFQLDLVNKGTSGVTINAILTGLRFFFNVTVDRSDAMKKTSSVPVPRKLPVILSKSEVTRLLESILNPKYKAALSVAYGAGLRAHEIVSLEISDIDSTRMLIRVNQGKGSRDRYTLLSPALLECLRDWWKWGNQHHQILKGGWLFPGSNPINHLSVRQLHRACTAAGKDAELDKHVTLHMFRHAFATHLLEDKVDIRVIQTLLGHKKLETTALYTQVATKMLQEVISPLDKLAPTDAI
jgi:integrase/recombinase XerD